MAAPDRLRDQVGFVLQQQDVAGMPLADRLVEVVDRQGVVGARRKHDRIVAFFIDQDQRVSGRGIADPDQRHVRPGLPERGGQRFPVRPDRPGVDHGGFGAGGGDGLIQPLAAESDSVGGGGQRLSRQRRVGQLVDFVQIQRADVDDPLHGHHLLSRLKRSVNTASRPMW